MAMRRTGLAAGPVTLRPADPAGREARLLVLDVAVVPLAPLGLLARLLLSLLHSGAVRNSRAWLLHPVSRARRPDDRPRRPLGDDHAGGAHLRLRHAHAFDRQPPRPRDRAGPPPRRRLRAP